MTNKWTTVTARFPEKLRKELERAAREERRPMSNLMQIFVEEGLERRKSVEVAKAVGALGSAVTN